MTKNNNNRLVGRDIEIAFLQEIADLEDSSIVVVYGRRRVGKTTLIEHVFGERNLIKIEGIEGGNEEQQLKQAISQLTHQLKEHPVAYWNPKSFTDLFRLLEPIVKKGIWTIFLEEYQWLSSYGSSVTSELKIAWDNWFSKNKQLKLILCGSSPSFMISKVLMSKALHNRSQYELLLKPMHFSEAKHLLPAEHDAFSAYLLLGGIPEYLKRIKKSWLMSFYKEAFKENGFFIDEFQRIIVSSLSTNAHYKKILIFLAKNGYADRSTIATHLKIKAGGSLSDLLDDLEHSGFIRSYIPIDKKVGSILKRYKISDFFLKTYFKFIYPEYRNIKQGVYSPPSLDQIQAHLGYAFEEYCYQNHTAIAALLGFSAVKYQVGSYFFRGDSNFQLDLIFIRADGVHSICEIKYNNTITSKGIANFNRAIDIYKEKHPNIDIEKVLIYRGTDKKSKITDFDKIITAEEIINLNKL